MAVTRHEARGNAREPDGGSAGTREAFVRNLFIPLGQVNAGRGQIGGRYAHCALDLDASFQRRDSAV